MQAKVRQSPFFKPNHITLGTHVTSSELMALGGHPFRNAEPKRALRVSLYPPRFALNRWSVKAVNELYYRRGMSGTTAVPLDQYLYPLDSLLDWNRIYGPDGFVQYQFAPPKAAGRDGLRDILTRIARQGSGSFLAVLKLFGAGRGFRSFPVEGYTLALDFPATIANFNLLTTLDAMVAETGGRIYLAKDALGLGHGARAATRTVALLGPAGPCRPHPPLRIAAIAKARTLTDGTKLSPVLVLGATSDSGLAVAHRCAEAGAGADLILAAREPDRLAGDAQDLRLQYRVEVDVVDFDILADVPGAWIDRQPKLPEVVVCVVGLLGGQAVSARDGAAAERVMMTNYVAPALLLGEVANRMEERGSGVIVGVSSVAGDRGRASNYIFGAAKAGFTAFLSGLRGRLSRTLVPVVTLKPGFVATKMTAGLKLPPLLTAQPREVAEATWSALQGGKDVVYVRPIWRWIMTAIAMIPEPVFKKMRFRALQAPTRRLPP